MDINEIIFGRKDVTNPSSMNNAASTQNVEEEKDVSQSYEQTAVNTPDVSAWEMPEDRNENINFQPTAEPTPQITPMMAYNQATAGIHNVPVWKEPENNEIVEKEPEMSNNNNLAISSLETLQQEAAASIPEDYTKTKPFDVDEISNEITNAMGKLPDPVITPVEEEKVVMPPVAEGEIIAVDENAKVLVKGQDGFAKAWILGVLAGSISTALVVLSAFLLK